jgi:hypothetical protein
MLPAWELAADTYLLKLQCLQNKVLRTINKFPSCTPARELHMAFQVPYICDYITKSCKQQAEAIKNKKVQMFATSEIVKPDTENIKGLSLAAVKRTTIQVTWQPL